LCEKTKFSFEKTHKLKIELMEKRLSMARFRKNEACRHHNERKRLSEARKPAYQLSIDFVIIIGILKTSANHQAITAKKDLINRQIICRS
jgi:tRNA-binding protein